MRELGSKDRADAESGRTHESTPSLSDHSFKGEVSDESSAYRTRRAGFPSVDDQPLDPVAVQARRTFIEELASGVRTPASVGLRGGLVAPEQYVACGRLALEFVESLAESRNGIRPTFYQVIACFRKASGFEDFNSKQFEVATRVLKSAWFSAEALGPKLWSGSEKALYDGIVYRFDQTVPDVAGMNLPGAVRSLLYREAGKLVSSAQMASALGFSADPIKASRLLSPTFQLLAETGEIVRHPDHIGALDSVNAVSVWSDAKGPWVKPALLNPEQVVLAHAAGKTGGWLFELCSNDSLSAGRFSNHTIKEAAQRLADRGFLILSRDLPPPGMFVPAGMRPYDRVRLTPEGERVVRPWCKIPEGGWLDGSNYEELRCLLVTRARVADEVIVGNVTNIETL
jgi:hypothetical protein